jgi:hypothetical protein
MENNDIRKAVLAAAAGKQRPWELLLHGYIGPIHACAKNSRLSPDDSEDIVRSSVWPKLLEQMGSVPARARPGADGRKDDQLQNTSRVLGKPRPWLPGTRPVTVSTDAGITASTTRPAGPLGEVTERLMEPVRTAGRSDRPTAPAAARIRVASRATPALFREP